MLPIAVAIPGPLQVYVGVPAPPPEAVVNVMLLPLQITNGEADTDTVGCILTATVVDVTTDVGAQPVPPKLTVTLYAALADVATVGVNTKGVDEDVVVLMPGPFHV